ncbi:hypothetical protein JRO89_XS14G0177400 [Xanthoceras sorbifolium]|uniref:PGG domain-containing protein n=1 Tax=Xanthoceras sorbifolium TaxID=99658 RepID=A0ABQ8H5J4_9ROSI|nr:hypothetical protein JRO89_XS14G0177400 [Xanthoceras sorbifolium]
MDSISSLSEAALDSYGQLYKAAVEGNMGPLRQIAQQLDLIVTPIRNTILHINIASERVSIQFVEEIIEICPTLLLQVNADGETPLHFAVEFDRPDVVEVLIKLVKAQHEDLENGIGASRQMLRMTDNKGNTALHKAMRKHCCKDVTGFYEGVVLMLETCSSVNHEGPSGKTTLHAAVRRRDKDTSAAYIADNCRKMNPLHLAASQGHIDILREIILYCPDCYKMVDDWGWNVLHFAMASLSLNPNISTSLLENRLLEKLLHEKDAKGNSPLHVFAALNPLALSFIEKVRGDRQAVNTQNVSVADTLRYSCSDLKKEILGLSASIGPYSRGVIHIRDKIKEENFKQLEKAKSSHLIVATLIATVTFAAAFTLPGGYKSEQGKNQGSAILSKNLAFQIFVTTNAMALVLSISAVFIYYIMSVDRFQKQYYLKLFLLAPWLTVLAMGAMVIVFISGSFAVLSSTLSLAIVTCFIGLSVFILLLRVLYCHLKGF